MRRKGSGTFDTTTRTWRLRTKGVQVSVKQLSDKYGIPITPTKQGSLAYWRKYLQEWEDTQRAVRKASSPLQERIRSLEARLSGEGRTVAYGRTGSCPDGCHQHPGQRH